LRLLFNHCRFAWVVWWRNLNVSCNSGLLKSIYRYFSRKSSDTSVLSCIRKGGVFALFNTVILVAATSISPVFISGLIVESSRLTTLPVTSTTYSLLTPSATATASSECFGLNTTCTIPDLSRKSIKISPPKSRRLCTHPLNNTVSPKFSLRKLSDKVRSVMAFTSFKQLLHLIG